MANLAKAAHEDRERRAIPFKMPLKRVTSRNTIVTRIRTAGGLSSEVYNGDNRAHGREIARIVEDEPNAAADRSPQSNLSDIPPIPGRFEITVALLGCLGNSNPAAPTT